MFEGNILIHLILFSVELCFGSNFRASKSRFLILEPVHFGHVMAYRVFLKHISNLFQLEKESNLEFGIPMHGDLLILMN